MHWRNAPLHLRLHNTIKPSKRKHLPLHRKQRNTNLPVQQKPHETTPFGVHFIHHALGHHNKRNTGTSERNAQRNAPNLPTVLLRNLQRPELHLNQPHAPHRHSGLRNGKQHPLLVDTKQLGTKLGTRRLHATAPRKQSLWSRNGSLHPTRPAIHQRRKKVPNRLLPELDIIF